MLNRRLSIILIALLLILSFPSQVFAQTDISEPAAGEIAKKHLENLSVAIGPRTAGTPSEKKAADYVFKELSKLGYYPKMDEFTFKKEVDGKEKSFTSYNVYAVKPGTSKNEIIVGAHYDSADAGMGADDNASSVAVMLEEAQKLAKVKTPYTIRFIAFGAEEEGLQGSKYYASKMTKTAVKNTLLMINLDSLIAGDNMYVYGGYGKEGLARDYAMKVAREMGMKLGTNMGENPEYPLGTTGDWSDHAPFKELGIPYVYFEGTNWLLGEKDGYTQVDSKYGEKGEVWHTQYDNIKYIEETFPGRIDEHLKTFSSVLHKLLTEYKF